MPQGSMNKHIYIRSDIPFSSVSLNTPLRAAAVKLTVNKRVFSACSIHLTDDRDYKVEEADLLNLLKQLPGSSLLLGDFNGHSPLWGCDQINSRGKTIEKFIINNNLCLFNDKSITHISDNMNVALSSLSVHIL